MAYPDFTTSAAPNFARDILGVLPTFNEMANINARTEVARQQQATSRWLAQIERAKKEQEIAMAPAIQKRQDELAQSEIALRGQQIAASRNQMNREATADPYRIASMAKAYQDQQDEGADDERALAWQAEALAMSPSDYADGGADGLRNKYLPQMHDPQKLYQQEHGFLAGNEAYSTEVAKSHFAPEVLDSYNTRLGQGWDEKASMAEALNDMKRRAAEEEAKNKATIEYSKAYGKEEGKADSDPGTTDKPAMTGPEMQRSKQIIDDLTKQDADYKKLLPEDRFAITEAANQAVIDSRKTKTLDQTKVIETLRKAKAGTLRAESWKQQNDRRFNFISR